MTPQEAALLQNLKLSFPYFAKHCLKIRTKSGDMLPFKMNRAQIKLHDALEEQLKRKGKIRAIVVKGRQMGSSTYVEGRFFHKLWSSSKALNAFILTHNDAATNKVFDMAKMFHEYLEIFKPELDVGNTREMKFSHNKAHYSVATAGNKDIGRGYTIQLFHGSEVSRWPNAEDHVSSAMQAVGNIPGTEIILESTANGIGNLFHALAMNAMAGATEFEVIFLPWFLDDTCATDIPLSEGHVDGSGRLVAAWFSPEWHQYGYSHGLAYEQLYWAYLTNREMAIALGEEHTKPCWKFNQEYPATITEAFQSSGDKSFIAAPLVQAARKSKIPVVPSGPCILGIDPARTGDKVGIVDRIGRRMGSRICTTIDPGGDSTYLASQLAAIINKVRPDYINIDTGGNGGPVFDMLWQMGYHDRLHSVGFGETALTTGPNGEKIYANRRAEMYDLMREWFTAGGVQIPDDDELHQDVCAPIWGAHATRDDDYLTLEPKDKIKARLKRSPDKGDAAALTFALPFYTAPATGPSVPRQRKSRTTGY